MVYEPISDYGIIGNMVSAALVARDGSIDWCCLPRFDSPSIFAAILDDEKGGRFGIKPSLHFESRLRAGLLRPRSTPSRRDSLQVGPIYLAIEKFRCFQSCAKR